MSYLFVQTLVIQLFVGIAFLLLGLWGGKYLWGHERHPGHAGGNEKAGKALDEELKRLRMLNGKLEKENHDLRGKVEVADLPVEAEEPASDTEVEETMEIVDLPVASEEIAGTARISLVKNVKPARAATKVERDALIRIRGIGKVMAGKLDKRGIHTYRQIAEWTKEEITKLPFGNLVGRDKWQAQARRLHKEKYGDKI